MVSRFSFAHSASARSGPLAGDIPREHPRTVISSPLARAHEQPILLSNAKTIIIYKQVQRVVPCTEIFYNATHCEQRHLFTFRHHQHETQLWPSTPFSASLKFYSRRCLQRGQPSGGHCLWFYPPVRSYGLRSSPGTSLARSPESSAPRFSGGGGGRDTKADTAPGRHIFISSQSSYKHTIESRTKYNRESQ